MRMTINILKRIVICCFAAVLVLSATSCSYLDFFSITPPDPTENPSDDGNDGDGDGQDKEFTLALYTGEALNPYTSINRANMNVLRLCYDGLVSLDNGNEAVPLIAEYELNGNEITFKIKKDAYFSDGTKITSADCVYSYSCASKDGSVYKSNIDNYIQSWKAVDKDTFQVVMRKNNIHNINLLDIPIIKSNSNNKTYPVGSGRYKIASGEDGEEILVKAANLLYTGNFEISEIKLLKLSNAQDLNYNFNYGIIHCAYADLSDGISRYKGNVELVSFPASTFVFAVLNDKKEYLKDNAVSKAISYCLNREKISKELFDGLCDPVWYPFNPNWSRISAAELNKDIYSEEEANNLFASAGFKTSGGVMKYRGADVPITIICNNEDLAKVEASKQLVADLEAMGFKTTLTQYNWNYYEEAIAKGEYDIYIGKVTVPANMDISFMLNPSICNNGKIYNWNIISSLDQFYSEEMDVRTFVSAFFEEMPFIPMYYCKGALAVNRIVSGEFDPSEVDILKGIENWSFDTDKFQR